MSEEITLPPEAKKTDWRDGKHPLSVRIKDASEVSFMDRLITLKGNAQGALIHCIRITMGLSADSVAPSPMEEISKLKKEKEELQRRLDATPAAAGFNLDTPEMVAIKDLREKKKHKDDHETLKYALSFTLDNDWL